MNPGAPPGTTSVNGNVTLASGSVSLFEIALTIANGAALKSVADGLRLSASVLYDGGDAQTDRALPVGSAA